jgi:pentatricopeptide repeat protein
MDSLLRVLLRHLLLVMQVCSRAGKIEEALDVFKETVRQHNVVTVGSFNRCVSGPVCTFVELLGMYVIQLVRKPR